MSRAIPIQGQDRRVLYDLAHLYVSILLVLQIMLSERDGAEVYIQ